MIVIAAILASVLSGGQAAVTGRILADATGDPIPNARVRIVAAGRTRLTTTDADGRFSVAAPRDGGLTISALKSGYVTREQAMAATSETIVLRLARAAVVSGRAIDRIGEPIVNGAVIVQTADGGRSIARCLKPTTADASAFRASRPGAWSSRS